MQTPVRSGRDRKGKRETRDARRGWTNRYRCPENIKKKKKTYVGWTRRGGRTRQAEPQSMDGGGIVSISSNVDKVRRGRREGEKVNEVSKRTRE